MESDLINKKRLLESFLNYVRIDSETGNEKEMAELLVKQLTEIGCETSFDNAGELLGCNAGNLYCVMNGCPELEPLLLCAHMDTVKPGCGIEPVIENGIIRSRGNTVLGGDDKAGVAAIVETLRTIHENALSHPTIEAVFTIHEEGGLLGSKHLNYGKIRSKKAAVLDSGGAPGKIITSAPGQVKLNVTIHGKSAHAGVSPEQGISAIQTAADAISRMQLLRIDEETTANIGTIKAEYATNIVPDTAFIAGEARSLDNRKLDEQAAHMMKCIGESCKKYGAAFSGGIEKSYAGYKLDEDDSWIQEIKTACEKTALPVVTAASGGGSDANQMNQHGIKAVPLGTGMTKVHSAKEELAVIHLEQTAELVLALATAL